MRCRRSLAALVLAFCTAGGLAGCADAITAYSVADGLDAVPDVPALTGRWISRDLDDTSPAVLEIGGTDDSLASCRSSPTRLTIDDETFEAGDQVCFVELNGYLIAELRDVSGPMPFYRQYLVRVEEDRIEVCGGFPVWVLFDELSRDHPTGYSLESLEITTIEHSTSNTHLLVAKPKVLREFLELALPALASACDGDTDDLTHWVTGTRMSAEDEAAADEE